MIYVKIFMKFPEHLDQIPQSRVLLEKLLAPQAHNKFLEFYGTRKFITVFTTFPQHSSTLPSLEPAHFSQRPHIIFL